MVTQLEPRSLIFDYADSVSITLTQLRSRWLSLIHAPTAATAPESRIVTRSYLL